MKVKYLIEVFKPRAQVGKKGETKELPDEIAKQMIAGSFVEMAKEKKKE
tara:strand:+ start:3839 stop:3985 length:147 start_codon:yes stop_codon:yes gene_type:complete